MFIRSQNKEILINANSFSIIEDFNSYCIVCDFYDGELYYLGEYSTKEKALKVMDMIQRQIVSCSESYEIVRPVLESDPFEPYWKKREVVFQMPKDSDDESEHIENNNVPEFLNKKMNLKE